MTRLLPAVLALWCASAHAGEYQLLGTLVSAGTSVTNRSTGTPFVIPRPSKLTIVCDVAVRVLTDAASTANSGATKGVPVAAGTLFPTSAGDTGTVSVSVSGVRSALIAMIPQTGSANCDVWRRAGTE